MIIARRFNAGYEGEFDKVPKGRLNGTHVLRQFLLPLWLDALGRPFGTCRPIASRPGVKTGYFHTVPSGTNFRRTELERGSRISREFGEIGRGTGRKLSPKCE
jgi:hypothetical protein